MIKKIQYALLFGITIFLFSCGTGSEAGEGRSPVIDGISMKEKNASSVSLTARFSGYSEGEILEKGFCWSSSNRVPTIEDEVKKITNGGASFEGTITGLAAGTTYYVRAYAKNAVGIGYSSMVSFVTDDADYSLTVTTVSGITQTEALFSASITGDINDDIATVGFCYSLVVANPSKEDSESVTIAVRKDFSEKVTGLSSDALYYVRAFLSDKNGNTVYGEANAFRTEISEEDRLLASFVAPSYADDYSPLSSWGSRTSWNLANVHDPTVEKCGEYYYMYGTDASYGNAHVGRGHFPYRRSKDLVNWEFQGMAMNQTPAWVKDTLNNMRGRQGLSPIDNPVYGHWAPVVRKAGNKYRMYYCIVIDNYIQTGKTNTSENFDNSWSERAFIGLMETSDLAGNNWEDKGMVVSSSTDREFDWSRPSLNNWSGYFRWNAIDPSFIVTPTGEHWLIYGSWHSGIVALKLNPTTGKPDELGEPWSLAALPNYGVRIATRSASSRWQGSEAPEIIYNEETGYYYLFLAYDELSVAYNTRVARSTSITGPYYGIDGANITAGADCFPVITHPYRFNNHSGWVGISHCAVFKDDNGKWYYSSQGRLPANTNGNAYSNAIMMGHVRSIEWTEDGWPVVMPERYAGVPDVAVKEAELSGDWEVINLSYRYQNQRTSSNMNLAGDKNATGAISGRWSFDQEKQILKVGSQSFNIKREVDWEASPRKLTLVFAGLSSDSRSSVWAKKVINQ